MAFVRTINEKGLFQLDGRAKLCVHADLNKTSGEDEQGNATSRGWL